MKELKLHEKEVSDLTNTLFLLSHTVDIYPIVYTVTRMTHVTSI